MKQYDLCIDVLCDINGMDLTLTELYQVTAITDINVYSLQYMYVDIVLRKHFQCEPVCGTRLIQRRRQHVKSAGGSAFGLFTFILNTSGIDLGY